MTPLCKVSLSLKRKLESLSWQMTLPCFKKIKIKSLLLSNPLNTFLIWFISKLKQMWNSLSSWTNAQVICGIPVKESVKYLGIHTCKNQTTRQNLNFHPRLNLTMNILNNWLQRDLSIIGRVLLSKAEGFSRSVYPALALYSSDSTCKNINVFLNFIWCNKQHKLKKAVQIIDLKGALK